MFISVKRILTDDTDGYSAKTKTTGMYIPNNEKAQGYDAIQKWIAEGNTPDPADVPVEPTWQEKREARYKAESDPLFEKARNQAIFDNLSPDYTVAVAKVTEIKTAIPKVV